MNGVYYDVIIDEAALKTENIIYNNVDICVIGNMLRSKMMTLATNVLNKHI